MVQIPINPFDNDRLKTRKVQAMLGELGVLPTADNERPTFLRGQRTAAILIDRALAHLAPAPPLRRCSNLQDTANTANAKFASAYEIDVGNGPVDPLTFADFSNAIYQVAGAPATIQDIIEENIDWNSFSYVDDYLGAGTYGNFNEDTGNFDGAGGYGGHPCVTHSLSQSLIGQSGGITLVASFFFQTGGFGCEVVDLPSFSQEIVVNMSAGAFSVFSGGSFVAAGTNPALQNAENKIAYSFKADGTLVASANGSEIISAGPAASITGNTIAFNLHSSALERLGVYPLQEDSALPMLSALA